ncbi:MAG: hypothetical protein J5I90_11055 [Caldilineales bacterium]|nr:hypothetical protein [Caldilineales bacterium]
MELSFTQATGDVTVRVERAEDGYSATILRPGLAPVTYQVEAAMPQPGRLILSLGERRVQAFVARDGNVRYVAMGGHSWKLEPPQPVGRKREAGGGSLTATMPGKVLDVLVEPGQEVEAGTPLVVLEAMKMELRVTAPGAGVVGRIFVSPGDVVERGQILVELA